jgi:hypothetical protein
MTNSKEQSARGLPVIVTSCTEQPCAPGSMTPVAPALPSPMTRSTPRSSWLKFVPSTTGTWPFRCLVKSSMGIGAEASWNFGLWGARRMTGRTAAAAPVVNTALAPTTTFG